MNPAIFSGEKFPLAQPLPDGVCLVLLQLLTSCYGLNEAVFHKCSYCHQDQGRELARVTQRGSG